MLKSPVVQGAPGRGADGDVAEPFGHVLKRAVAAGGVGGAGGIVPQRLEAIGGACMSASPVVLLKSAWSRRCVAGGIAQSAAPLAVFSPVVLQKRAGAAGGVDVRRWVIAKKCEGPAGGVLDARGIAKKRLVAAGSVVEAGGIVPQRLDAAGGVFVAPGIAKKRVGTAGGVVVTPGIVPQRVMPKGGVPVPSRCMLGQYTAPPTL